MDDTSLFVFGVVVSFIACAGAYVALREAFLAQGPEREPLRDAGLHEPRPERPVSS